MGSSREYYRQRYAEHKDRLLPKARKRAKLRWELHPELILTYNKNRCHDGTSKNAQYSRTTRERQKALVLEHYGPRCACCGETGIEFLGVDHVLGNGNRSEFTKPSRGGGSGWREAISSGFSSDFRILCHNCNNSAFRGCGVCRHNRGSLVPATAKQRNNLKLKLLVIATYGGKCACCNITEPEFLTVDHVNGGGRQERARTNRARSSWRSAKLEGFPSHYRLLCFSCNQSAAYHKGVCCHQVVQTDGSQ